MVKHTRWLVVWTLSATISIGGWLVFECYWREAGYAPSVMDSIDLWSLNRARAVKASPPLRVALLGASRIQFGLSPAVFRDEARAMNLAVDPIMLAVNGNYPLAALRDLAEDEKFVGVAVVGIDARGMDKKVWEMQGNYVHHYHHDWSPSRELHRRLLTRLQTHAIAARPDFSVITLAKRGIDHLGPPQKEYVTFDRDRSGGSDYQRGDIAAIGNARVAELANYYRLNRPPPPIAWLNETHDIIRWVKRINARGGKVVFYREPVSSGHIELDEANFPRAEYWDRLAAIFPGLMLDFHDYPTLLIDTPDTSHIDIRDIDRHTRALVRVLRAKQVL